RLTCSQIYLIQIFVRCLTMLGHFGFECLPHQLVNQSIQQGFSFNILCVGETGIGKSTLIDTLFNTNLKDKKSSHFYSNVGLKIQTYELQESNVQLKLTVVKTVGYGDQINKEASYQPIVEYVDAQFEAYLQEELKIKRSFIDYHDSRIHVCLYFISPTGHSLKSIDLLTMKNIDNKVNIIPLIAKADTISKNDLQKFKCKIVSELVSNGIQIYQFPTDDETTAQVNSSMNGRLRELSDIIKWNNIHIIGISEEEERGKGAEGVLEEIIAENCPDLGKETGIEIQEAQRTPFRCNLNRSSVRHIIVKLIYEDKRQKFYDQCQREEEELKQKFMQRVKDKETTFKESEKELQEKFEHLKRVQQEETMKLEEKRRQLEEEIMDFYKLKAVSGTLQTLPSLTILCIIEPYRSQVYLSVRLSL
uniref:Septin n=1 Tax=Panthera leo TaxID=9689 RepID=A0A8C8XHJ3_PANLE